MPGDPLARRGFEGVIASPNAEVGVALATDGAVPANEERQEPRYPVQIRASLLINGRNFDLASENVSRRGVFFRSNDPVRPRQLVRLRLVLPPHGEVLIVPAMVAHAIEPGLALDGAPGFGVRFVGLDGVPQETWLRFLRQMEAPLLVPQTAADPELTPYRPLADYAVYPPTAMHLEALVVEEIAQRRILVPTYAPAVVGAPVRVHVVHPTTGESFALDGTVVRFEQRARGIALVELVHLTEEVQQALFAFVNGIAIDDSSIVDLEAASPGSDSDLAATREASAFDDPEVLEAMRATRSSKTKLLPADELEDLVTRSSA